MPQPIEVKDSTVAEQTGSGLRDLTLILAALPVLVTLFGKGDVQAIVNYLASNEGIAFVGALVAIGTVIWRQFIARKNKHQLVKVADAADDRVAVVIPKT